MTIIDNRKGRLALFGNLLAGDIFTYNYRPYLKFANNAIYTVDNSTVNAVDLKTGEFIYFDTEHIISIPTTAFLKIEH